MASCACGAADTIGLNRKDGGVHDMYWNSCIGTPVLALMRASSMCNGPPWEHIPDMQYNRNFHNSGLQWAKLL